MILDKLEDLRREAYVRAIIRASESDSVVGYAGRKIPVEIFHAMGLTPYPIYGIDREILSFSTEKNLCPLIDATVTYAKTDKCPLIHSSKLIVVDDTCPTMTKELTKVKDVYVYDGDENLISKLREVYRCDDVQSDVLMSIQTKLQRISDFIKSLGLPEMQAFTIEYFVKFLDVDERMKFLADFSSDELRSFNDVHEFVSLIYGCANCKQ
ncbi:MAG: 2-hydroxyacyl-CoA dehydratase [Synergistaceae bacterium]|nr:2-hydroxyacyl-CoA dehydratase [Synergistaceae bacterium]